MRRLFLAALGILAVAGVASAQQPQYQQPPIQYPAQYPTVSPGAVAATPVQPTAGATVIQGSGGCSNCGPTTGKAGHNFTMSNVTGGSCLYGYRCQNGCGSIKSDLAFQFGNCTVLLAVWPDVRRTVQEAVWNDAVLGTVRHRLGLPAPVRHLPEPLNRSGEQPV